MLSGLGVMTMFSILFHTVKIHCLDFADLFRERYFFFSHFTQLFLDSLSVVTNPKQ